MRCSARCSDRLVLLALEACGIRALASADCSDVFALPAERRHAVRKLAYSTAKRTARNTMRQHLRHAIKLLADFRGCRLSGNRRMAPAARAISECRVVQEGELRLTVYARTVQSTVLLHVHLLAQLSGNFTGEAA